MHRRKEGGIFAGVGNFAMVLSVLIGPNGNLAGSVYGPTSIIGQCRVTSDNVASTLPVRCSSLVATIMKSVVGRRGMTMLL